MTWVSTEEAICSVEIATASDVDTAVKAARAAFNSPAWREVVPEDRGKLLHKLADLVEKNLEQIFTLQAWDVGKPFPSSMAGESVHMLGTLCYFAGWADKIHGQTIPVSKDKFGYTLRQPIGVCAGISPWNYRLTNSAWKLGPALATGNCIILEPSEHSPRGFMPRKVGEGRWLSAWSRPSTHCLRQGDTRSTHGPSGYRQNRLHRIKYYRNAYNQGISSEHEEDKH